MRRPTIPILAVVLSAACGGELPEPTDPDTLKALNQELMHVYDGQRLTAEQRHHFRPLCDPFGFPLVGNIHSKGGMTASEYCALIRKP